MDWAIELRGPLLTPIWKALTFLGELGFFLTVVPLLYWLWRKEVVARVAILLMLSAALNAHLKHVFVVPRPFTVAANGIDALVEASGWSMPSGHAQMAAGFWGAWAWELRQRWAFAAAAGLAVMVSLSRVVLGVHYPRDVIVGATIGTCLLLGFYVVLARVRRPLVTFDLRAQVGLAVVGVAVWMGVMRLTTPEASIPREAGVALGALLGLWVGLCMEVRRIDFEPPKTWLKRAAVAVLGMLGIIALRYGLKALFADLPGPVALPDALRYAVMGLWISWGAPWLFVRQGFTTTRLSQTP